MSGHRIVIDTVNTPANRKLWSEVGRCLLCEEAPCAKSCPRGLRPDRRIRALRFMDLYGAAENFPDEGCTGCGACESSCVLGSRPIEIRRIMEEAERIARTAQDLPDSSPEPDLSAEICGVRLENPFLLSSSVVASNYEMCAKALSMGWAGVCFKTICTFDQHEASPRFSVLRDGPEGFYGFKNIEQLSDHAVRENMEIFRRLKKDFPEKVIIASIMGRDENEWEELARECQLAGADVIECNFSCPNMEDGALGVTIGQSEELIEKFTRAARKGCSVPLLAKMTPNITDMVPMAAAAKRGGADGIAAINTIKSVTGVNKETLVPQPAVHGKSSLGGYSGRAVKPIALRFISELAQSPELAGMHLSGMGGIENWEDALEFILLGSGSLQITTAVMQYGYRIIDDLLTGLAGYMRERNIPDIGSLLGKALDSLVTLDDVERDTVLFPAFRTETCVGCGRCYLSCFDGGHQAILFDPQTRRPQLIGSKCVGCHLCRLVCPTGSIITARRRVYRAPIRKADAE